MNAITKEQMDSMDDMGAFGQRLVESELDDCMADRIELPPLPAEACSEVGFENEPAPAPADDPEAWAWNDCLLMVTGFVMVLLALAHLLDSVAKGMQ